MSDSERESGECCSICGVDLYDKDEGVGVTTGSVDESAGGFADNGEPWLYVFCQKCYDDTFVEMMDRIDDIRIYLNLTRHTHKEVKKP